MSKKTFNISLESTHNKQQFDTNIFYTQERRQKLVLTKLINVLWFFTSSPPLMYPQLVEATHTSIHHTELMNSLLEEATHTAKVSPASRDHTMSFSVMEPILRRCQVSGTCRQFASIILHGTTVWWETSYEAQTTCSSNPSAI